VIVQQNRPIPVWHKEPTRESEPWMTRSAMLPDPIATLLFSPFPFRKTCLFASVCHSVHHYTRDPSPSPSPSTQACTSSCPPLSFIELSIRRSGLYNTPLVLLNADHAWTAALHYPSLQAKRPLADDLGYGCNEARQTAHTAAGWNPIQSPHMISRDPALAEETN
jgi:hypothetical protein